MRRLQIYGHEFVDAYDQSGSLDKVHRQIYLKGGSLHLLPNGMLQRKCENAGVTRTFIRLPESMPCKGYRKFP